MSSGGRWNPTKIDIYSGRDPVEVPAYTLTQVAEYLGIPTSTLRNWSLGGPYPVKGGTKTFEPVIEMADPDRRQLSFSNLVEAHVLSALRKDRRIRLQDIRQAVKELRRAYPRKRHPLIEHEFVTVGMELFVRHLEEGLVNYSRGGQTGIYECLKDYLRRIDYAPELSLYPFTRDVVTSDAPKLVVMNPRVSFGRPVIAGTSIPTEAVYRRWRVGESMEEMAEDYDRTVPEIEEALRWESARRKAA